MIVIDGSQEVITDDTILIVREMHQFLFLQGLNLKVEMSKVILF